MGADVAKVKAATVPLKSSAWIPEHLAFEVL
jgi:hypothetical protein